VAELDIIREERPGIKKIIDEGAYDLIFQAVQEDMYSYPIPSFVREGISNGLDAIVERTVFEAINGGQPVENYYLQRNDGKLLKDSAFDDGYYNPAFLGKSDKVLVTYTEDSPRDNITIKDSGVGLGGSRLKGFFKLGYSSKRNMKHVIGKFGAGAKAGLATGVEYFTMETIYNGFKTSFMILKHDYDPITPEHAKGKTDVWVVPMENGDLQKRNIYWAPTTEPNGVKITLEVKKHNKDKFIKAVKSQFQYFNGRVHFTHIKTDGSQVVDKLDEAPLYESDVLLIPKYSTYSSPHILVDGISYGTISWPELELEGRQGRIAIKVKATDVDITQARESLKWTEKTRKAILSAVDLAQEEASDYMTKRMNLVDDQDIFHLNRLYSNMYTRDRDSVDNVFKKFLNITNIQAKFILREPFKDIRTRMSYPLFEFLFYSFTMKKLTTYKDEGKVKIRTELVESFSAIGDAKIIYAEGASLGPRLAVHLLEKYDVGHFIYVRKNASRVKSVLEFQKKEYPTSTVNAYTRNLLEQYADLNLDKYEVVYDEKEEDLEGEIKEVKETGLAALSRRANKEVLYMSYEKKSISLNGYQKFTYKRVKNTIKQDQIGTRFEDFPEGIIIVPGKFTNLGKLVELACYLTTGKFPDNVVYISQEVVRYFLPHGILVTDYFRQLDTKTGELMIGKHIRDLNTLRIFRELMKQYDRFSQNDNIISTLTDIDFHQYDKLRVSSEDTNPRVVIEEQGELGSDMLDEIFGYLKVLEAFQQTVKTGDKELIAKEALELFGSEEIYYLDAYNEEFIDVVKNEFERLGPIEPVLAVTKNVDLENSKELFNLLLNTKNKLRDDHI
jgi:hypothetical protein